MATEHSEEGGGNYERGMTMPKGHNKRDPHEDPSLRRLMDRDTNPPTEAEVRKTYPLYTGLLKYFPDALAAVAHLSKVGNDQHNPGQPLHWDRDKSKDQLDAMMRHLKDHAKGDFDTDGERHLTKAVWRGLAELQLALEAKDTETPKLVAGFVHWGPPD